MERMVDAMPVAKVHWLVVDKEGHIDTVKKLQGIEHHMTVDTFFDGLENLAREFPNPNPPPFKETEKSKDWDDDDVEVPSHVRNSLTQMRKRRTLVLDIPRLISHWPAMWPGYPNLLVTSVTDAAFGYVGRVPEAFHFMADTVCIIRQNKTSGVRKQNDSAFFDKVAEVFPVDMTSI
jgi:hypothetical protein